MVLLWFASARPPSPDEPGLLGPFAHNGAHVVAYFVLGCAWTLALLARRWPRPGGVSRTIALASVLLTSAYGIVDELHQSHVPGRCCSFWDACSDLSGGLLAVAFLRWVGTGERRYLRHLGGLCVLGLGCVALATWPPF
jgi:VanZ family protein